uniref:Gustatory receptor n=1 Tax=Anopheles epiroticus TaxID=199890 RepID=A0A182PYV0_9DIPT
MEAEQQFRSFYNFYRHHRIDRADKTNPFKLNPYRHKLFIAKSVLILLLCILLGLCAKSYEHRLIPNRSCINRLINWCCFASSLSTAFVVAWEALAGSREDVQIWNTFHAIEIALNVCNANSQTVFEKTQRVYRVIFYTLVALLCALAGILLIECRIMKDALVGYIVVFLLLSTVDMHRILHILLYVRILTSYLRRVKGDFRIIVEMINARIVGTNHDYEIQQKLSSCCTCYFLCIKLFEQIQQQFTCGLFMVCLKFSIIIWNEIYWTVYRAIMEKSFELYSLNMVPYHFTFICFTWTCECLTAEIKAISQLLNTIHLDKASHTIRLRITHLMLLLNYEVFFFHTIGVCKVSYKCIVQFIISGATKVSFIAQIMKDFYSDMQL